MSDFPTSNPTRTADITTLMPGLTPQSRCLRRHRAEQRHGLGAAESGRLFPRHALPTTSTGVKEVDAAIDRFEQYTAERVRTVSGRLEGAAAAMRTSVAGTAS